jgi:hypothetical protein
MTIVSSGRSCTCVEVIVVFHHGNSLYNHVFCVALSRERRKPVAACSTEAVEHEQRATGEAVLTCAWLPSPRDLWKGCADRLQREQTS